MLYLNQLEYAHIAYPTDIGHPDSEYAVRGNVRMAGCGLCAACMVVDKLRGERFSLEACRDLSVRSGANREAGTNMQILGAAVAERFQLRMNTADDTAELASCLHRGGIAIANTGGDRNGYTGIFSNIGHYIVVTGEARGEFQILDPSWTPEKYAKPPRCEQVRQEGKLLYAAAGVLRADTASRSPAFYLFRAAARLKTIKTTG